MFFRQLLDNESCTYTYIIADLTSKEALIIDPVKTQIETYKTMIKEHGLTLKYSLETHVHADHITASGTLREQLNCLTGVSRSCEAKHPDIHIEDGDVFQLGANETIRAITTPGHTKGSLSFIWQDKIFTGDSLLINGCGRTDFQGGDAATLFDSITRKIFSLQDDTLIYPGHDYKGQRVSSVGQEKTLNPRLTGKTQEEFVTIMNNLNLPKPRLIDIAVPANRYCGSDPEKQRQIAESRTEITKITSPETTLVSLLMKVKSQIKEVTVEQSHDLILNGNICLIDIREESECADGIIDSALEIPRGMLEFKIDAIESIPNKSATILLYCRSGNRSALAASALQQLGYTNVLSMIGGYQAWLEYVTK
tara:strand:- start:31929 stop:33026 length:1098 start_codon:yes stop_codon:yes gene_type:complete